MQQYIVYVYCSKVNNLSLNHPCTWWNSNNRITIIVPTGGQPAGTDHSSSETRLGGHCEILFLEQGLRSFSPEELPCPGPLDLPSAPLSLVHFFLATLEVGLGGCVFFGGCHCLSLAHGRFKICSPGRTIKVSFSLGFQFSWSHNSLHKRRLGLS